MYTLLLQNYLSALNAVYYIICSGLFRFQIKLNIFDIIYILVQIVCPDIFYLLKDLFLRVLFAGELQVHLRLDLSFLSCCFLRCCCLLRSSLLCSGVSFFVSIAFALSAFTVLAAAFAGSAFAVSFAGSAFTAFVSAFAGSAFTVLAVVFAAPVVFFTAIILVPPKNNLPSISDYGLIPVVPLNIQLNPQVP